jgi:hypothetical protein
MKKTKKKATTVEVHIYDPELAKALDAPLRAVAKAFGAKIVKTTVGGLPNRK